MIVALALCFLVQQPSEKKPVPLPGIYAHPFHAYKIQLPAGWARGPSNGRAQASFYAPKVEAYTPRVDLHIHKGVKEFGAFATKFRESIRTALPDVAFPVDEVTAVRGRIALFLTATFTDGGVAMKSLWILVSREERVYQLGWACTAAFFPRFAPAIEAMLKSIRIYPEPAVSKETAEKFLRLYEEGEAAYRAEKYDDAVARFGEAADLLPDYPQIYATLGTAQLRRKDYAKSEAAYKRAQELDPDDASYAYNYGNALLQQKKYGLAIEALSRATAAEPGFEPAWTNLGAARLAQKEYDAAAAALEKAVLADPESIAAHFNLAVAYEALGKTAKAAAQFKETLKLDPKHEGAREGLKRVS